MNYILVFIGGGLGSVLRFCMALLIERTNLTLPIATLCSNVMSCSLFVALLYMYHEKNAVPDHYKHFVLVGICGGLSTFSTFSFETFELFKQGLVGWALLNIAISYILCTTIFFVFVK